MRSARPLPAIRHFATTTRTAAALAALLCALAGGWAQAQPRATDPTPARAEAPYAHKPDVPRLTALGRALFFDTGLSASGRVSCASCHDPAYAYGPSNAAPVQPNGVRRATGFRATPSLRYLHSVPPFSEHHHDNDGDDSIDMGPTGGRTWDGRVDSAHEQARLPLLSPDEMGNASPQAVIAKLRRAPYAAQLRDVFGADVFERGTAAFDAALMALEVFQESAPDFYPYTSRYDAVLRGQAELSAQEARGLALFDDPAKGNCASCHLSARKPDGAYPLFTDFGHIAIGVPRNPAIVANADPRFFDLGLCGPLRRDLADRAEDCGRFRTPTLRNVAVRRSFFHNGAMHTLEDTVRFYAQRDTDPARWYGREPDGSARHFDDLPARYHGNVNTEAPFGAPPGAAPALSEAEIADVVAFLKTLTDADQ